MWYTECVTTMLSLWIVLGITVLVCCASTVYYLICGFAYLTFVLQAVADVPNSWCMVKVMVLICNYCCRTNICFVKHFLQDFLWLLVELLVFVSCCFCCCLSSVFYYWLFYKKSVIKLARKVLLCQGKILRSCPRGKIIVSRIALCRKILLVTAVECLLVMNFYCLFLKFFVHHWFAYQQWPHHFIMLQIQVALQCHT